MLTDELLIEKTIKLYEDSTGWGDSNEWTNQDFVILSEKIQERTGVAISHVTLKRVWGKVKYESLPNTHTLDTLVQFLGYENWRDFKSQHAKGNVKIPVAIPADNAASEEVLKQIIENADDPEDVQTPPKKAGKVSLKSVLFIVGAILLIAVAVYIIEQPPAITNNLYSFSSKKVVSVGLPNSVIFNYDATKSPYDSVVIQQSWDTHLQAKVSKYQHQHTSIYYYPDYYKAKLLVGGKIVSMHRLLIKTDGWLPIVDQKPVPVYFSKQEAIANGKMSLSVDQIQARNIKMQPQTPNVLFTNVRDFGEIYSDDFNFETSVRNDYHEGAAICQSSRIYLLCEGTAIYLPLSIKGCISDLDMLFTNFYTSGKTDDLSNFGVDFSKFVKVRIESKNRKANIFINDKLAYTVKKDVIKAKIIGIYLSFQGAGSVDYVKLSNGKVNYEDDF